MWIYLVIFPLFFLGNFLILFGPMVFMGVSQMRAYEPGDADWGVKLDDVRGQAEAKEEVRRVVTLWQSGEAFEKAGGKRERGLLLLGAPGTGKTMLSKAIATNFNAPFVSMPGSGFAQTFIGMDVVIVRYLASKAKRLARKWGGQCIVFIDEIDAVGMRRRSLGTGQGFSGADPGSFHDFCFYGPNGALTSTGDLVLETRAWRERLFAERHEPASSPYPPAYQRLANFVFPGGMGGGNMGGLALNQLLVVMDGIGDPPFWRRFWTNRFNTLLDASYVVPRRAGTKSLRFPKPQPRQEQIFFVGACNVPIEVLDPALIRPGRMGRHVWFRTPTRQDRLDVFNLYINKVAHEEDLDTPARRDELARITNGYSPAMIEQVCSMALTIAHYDGRERFGWPDIVDAMTSIESGTAINIEYVAEETRAVAIHEAGHAVAAHVYMKGTESTRLSIRRRGRALGHHQALEKEERFTSWRHEEMGRLIWTLGAMAAERVFYGENSTGVGGDVQSATARAAWMVGSCAMAPERVDLDGRFETEEQEEEAREKIMKRFERIGSQIMQRAGSGGPYEQNPIAGVLGDPSKRALAAQLLGQAYIAAHQVVAANRDGRRAHRRRPRRAARAPRRRSAPPPRRSRARATRGRSSRRKRVAEAVSADDTETLPEPAEAEPGATSAPSEEQPVTERRLPQEPEADHRPKFRLVYAALAAIAALAAVGARLPPRQARVGPCPGLVDVGARLGRAARPSSGDRERSRGGVPTPERRAARLRPGGGAAGTGHPGRGGRDPDRSRRSHVHG